ncbi:glycosyltransferase [Hyphomonas sp.]|uniref:glycosyltransferase n=1 Tax=Hyphomonas sp. TaxID=87 RepID=UPI000A7234B8|nr:glycosyltransferase [Hyphomonas sp.]
MAELTARRLELRAASDGSEGAEPGWQMMLLEEAIAGLKRGHGIGRWHQVRLVLPNPYALPNPVKTGLALLLMSPARAEIVSGNGSARRAVTPWSLVTDAVRGLSRKDHVIRGRAAIMGWLATEPVRSGAFAPASGPPMVLRTGLWFGAKVGGAFSHAAGVINAIFDRYGGLDIVSTDQVPGLRSAITTRAIDLAQIEGWTCGDGLYLAAQPSLAAEIQRLVPAGAPAFVYQRSGLGDISGLRFARARRRPFVLEYNGPEVWVAEKWGTGLGHSQDYQKIETELLRRADLVLAVSQPLVEEAIARGADASRVLLSPNAAEAARFHPSIDGDPVRRRLGLEGQRVAMLVSSFGPWHGVETTLDALAEMNERNPSLVARSKLVLVGRGSGYDAARAQAEQLGISAHVIFTGPVPSESTPEMLAAADVLLSPQVHNRDGTLFFGSPTKLFEYMAMGKPIIASDLAQIGEILDNEKTALLTGPGDVSTLALALERALSDPAALAPLGAAARALLEAEHTWDARIAALDAALQRIGAGAAP